MKTKVATSLVGGAPNAAAEALRGELLTQLGGEEPAFTLLFASTRQPLAELLPRFKAGWKGPVLGASTAGEFTEKGDAKGSVAAVAVSGDFSVHAGIGRGLKANPEQAVREAIAKLPTAAADMPHRTAVMLLDPLAGNGEETVGIASRILGPRTRLAGGAAGDDLAMKGAFVGVDDQVASDAVVLAMIFSKQSLGVGVHHGHHPLSRTLTVTRAQNARVQEIDGRPAWEVWKRHTREHAEAMGVNPETLSERDIGAFLLRYEAAISVGSELRVRAPLSLGPDGSIDFACAIPQGTVVRITESTPSRQISSARSAARLSRQQMGAGGCAGAIVFDCICRNLILGAEFSAAVAGISQELGGARLAGFETYGEIALDAGDMSGFHNTTTVVLTLPQ